MKILKLILALSLFFSLAACSDDDNGTTPSSKSNELWPLAIGNSWTYQGYSQNDDNSEGILLCSDTINLNGVNYFFFGSYMKKFINKPDGVYYYNDETEKPELNWKYPCAVGDTFLSNGYKYTVESTSEKIKVGAGTFTCIKDVQIDIDDPPSIHYTKDIYWFCPGIGLIKNEFYKSYNNEPEVLYTSMLLKSYSIK